MKRKQYDDAEIQRMTDLYHSGISIQQIAREFNVDRDVISRIFCEKHIYPEVIPQDTVDAVCNLLNTTTLTLADICSTLNVPYVWIQRIQSENYTQDEIRLRKTKMYSASKHGSLNPMSKLTGSSNPKWKGGVVDDGNGYLIQKKPGWFTGHPGKHYVFQHQVIMAEAMKLTDVPEGFVIHHIDWDTRNNELNNLALMSAGAHARLHSYIETKDKEIRALKQEISQLKDHLNKDHILLGGNPELGYRSQVSFMLALSDSLSAGEGRYIMVKDLCIGDRLRFNGDHPNCYDYEVISITMLPMFDNLVEIVFERCKARYKHCKKEESNV